LTTRDPPPVSYATTTYFGVNSFKFVNEKGTVTIGRYQLLPDAGRHFLSKDESTKAATNYLEDEIRQRVARGAIRFKVVLQLAAPGDKIDDPSVAWASTNKITTLGTLTVASVVPDSEATERELRAAGFRDVRWHQPTLSPEGASAYGRDYWSALLDHPQVIFIECFLSKL